MSNDWDRVAPRLVAAYHRGLLVPFVGAGLSVPRCKPWGAFICAIEQEAGLVPGNPHDGTAGLIARAEAAVRALGFGPKGRLAAGVRQAMIGSDGLPKQTQLLADIWWPLVVSTNYDNVLPAAIERRWNQKPQVLGRSPVDCFLVSRALREPIAPVIWAIQGFLDAPEKERFDEDGDLADEVVVGHAAYRKVTFAQPHFRRAFAEVYRARSLFFLGSGLREHYLLDLLSEVRETFGPNSHPHYAVCPKGEVDVDFLARQFQISVVEYDAQGNHEGLHELLDELASRLRTGARTTAWTFGTQIPDTPELGVVVGTLPLASLPAPAECVAVSSGGVGTREPEMSNSVRRDLAPWVAGQPFAWRNPYVGRWGETPFFTARARDPQGRRSLESVYYATVELLRQARALGYHTVHTQVLASGQGIWNNPNAPFRPVHAFVEMVAAFGDWVREERVAGRFRFVVHVFDPSIYTEIRRGRLDVLEHFSCADVRFWVSIEPEGRPPEYHLVHAEAGSLDPSGHAAIRDDNVLRLAQRLQVPADWHVEVWPSPQRRRSGSTVQDLAEMPLAYFAVAGSILRFYPRR